MSLAGPKLQQRRRHGPAIATVLLTACAAHSMAQPAEPGASTALPNAPIAPSANAGSAAAQRTWSLRLPAVDRVEFRGSVSADPAGLGTSAMVYPAPGVAGLLVAMAVHGLVNSSRLQNQQDQLRQADSQVLQPYEPVLAAFTHRQLMQAGVQKMSAPGGKRLLAASESAGGDWLVESTPVFSMTQDQRALVLDNTVRIVAPGSSKTTYAQTIRWVSAALAAPAPPTATNAPADSASAAAPDPLTPTDQPPAPEVDGIAALWLESQGLRLTDVSSSLFAATLDVAFNDALTPLGDVQAAHKTFRYFEGGREKMERAQLVSQRCDRTLIRTLRGWLMSIPTPATDCVAP